MTIPSETFVRCVRSAQHALVKYGVQPLAAPIRIEQIAEQLGFQVVRIHSASESFSGLLSPKHKLIGVNANHHPHRQRFTLAHEVGHLILRHPAEGECTLRQIDALNREADVCASELLIPTQLLAPHLFEKKRTAVGTLSRLFDVSEEAMSLKIQHINEFLSVT